MPGVISFLSAADIPGTNAYVQPPLALFEAQPVSFMYRKHQKLSGRKLSRFLQIFDELQKFSLLIDRRHTVDIIMEAKL